MTTKILVGDCRQTLKLVPDQSVHCVITSPPYWGLRSYHLNEWTGGDPDCKHEGKPVGGRGGSNDYDRPSRNHGKTKPECKHCDAVQISVAGGIGMEPTWDEHLGNLLEVFDEVWRVMRNDGTLWLNYGDAYWGGKGASSSTKEAYERRESDTLNKSYQHVNEFGGTRPLDRRDQIWKPKDLVMMPARIAIALQEHGCADLKAVRILDEVMQSLIDHYRGDESIPDKVLNTLDMLHKEYTEAKGNSWYLRSEIVWAKKNSMPESVKDRPTSSHEKIYLFAKQPKYFYDHVAVRTSMSDASLARLNQPTFESQKGGPKDSKTGNRSHRRTLENLKRREESGSGGSNLKNVWHLPTRPFKEAHFATFPTDLVEPCIKAGTSGHGVCSDCSVPYTRDVEYSGGTIGKSWHDHSDDLGKGQDAPHSLADYKIETKGWKSSCECKGEIQPAVVLDPFGGAGTVSLVAERLRRDSIICEISAEYAEIARKRIESESLPMFPTDIIFPQLEI